MESPQTEVKKLKTFGNREEVFLGLAKRTKGNLLADDIELVDGQYKSIRAKKNRELRRLNTPLPDEI